MNRLLTFVTILALSACTSSPTSKRDHAFIKHWPAPKGSTALRLAVKDLIDIKGYVTSAGSEYVAKHSAPATEDAECLRIARERGVHIVGKTNLTEFAITVSGDNRFFGTPRNRWDGKRDYIPGGSSSGSAVAVATDRADIAFGTDTGGSIRVPAGVLRHLWFEDNVRTRLDERRVSHLAHEPRHRRPHGKGHSASRAGHGSIATWLRSSLRRRSG